MIGAPAATREEVTYIFIPTAQDTLQSGGGGFFSQRTWMPPAAAELALIGHDKMKLGTSRLLFAAA